MTNSDAGRKAFEEWFSQWIENPSGYDIEEAFKGGEQASRKHQAEQQGVDKHELLLEVMRGMIGHNLPVEGREIVAMDVVDRLISKGYVTNPAEPVDLEVCAFAASNLRAHKGMPDAYDYEITKAILEAAKAQGARFDYVE